MTGGKYELEEGEEEIMWSGNVCYDLDGPYEDDLALTNRRLVLVRYCGPSYDRWSEWQPLSFWYYDFAEVLVTWNNDNQPMLEIHMQDGKAEYFSMGTSEQSTRIWAMAVKDYMHGENYGKAYYIQMFNDLHHDQSEGKPVSSFDPGMFFRDIAHASENSGFSKTEIIGGCLPRTAGASPKVPQTLVEICSKCLFNTQNAGGGPRRGLPPASLPSLQFCSFRISCFRPYIFLNLQLRPSFKGAEERHLVYVFNVAADRDAGSDPRHADPGRLDQAGDVHRRRLPLEGGICCDDDFVDVALQPLHELLQADVIRPDALHR